MKSIDDLVAKFVKHGSKRYELSPSKARSELRKLWKALEEECPDTGPLAFKGIVSAVTSHRRKYDRLTFHRRPFVGLRLAVSEVFQQDVDFSGSSVLVYAGLPEVGFFSRHTSVPLVIPGVKDHRCEEYVGGWLDTHYDSAKKSVRYLQRQGWSRLGVVHW